MRFPLSLIILIALTIGAAAQGCGAQNPNCVVPTAPLGTRDNQAASTAFAQSAASNPTSTTPLPWIAALLYTGNGAGSTGTNLLSVRGTIANPITDSVATAIFQSTSELTTGQGVTLYASLVKRGMTPMLDNIAGWFDANDQVGGGSISGVHANGSCTGGTGGNCTGITGTGAASVAYSYVIANEGQVFNNSGSDANVTFSSSKFAAAFLATGGKGGSLGSNKSDVAFLINPFTTVPFIYGLYIPTGTIDSTGSVVYSAATTAYGANFLNCTCIPFRSTNFEVDGSGNVTGNGSQFTETTLTGAPPTVTSGQIGYGGTTAASSNCGSLMSAVACITVNVAGTAHYVPYY
jgi:hypothetical protein